MTTKEKPVRAFTKKYSVLVRILTVPVTISNILNSYITRNFEAILDTGASASSINQKIAEEMELPIVSYAKVSTANGVKEAPIYMINLVLPNRVSIPHLRVTGTDLGEVPMLIGMDVLSMGDFAISNYNGKTIVNFRIPSFADIDYVSQLNSLNPAKSHKACGRNDPCPCGSGKKYKNCCGKQINQSPKF